MLTAEQARNIAQMSADFITKKMIEIHSKIKEASKRGEFGIIVVIPNNIIEDMKLHFKTNGYNVESNAHGRLKISWE